MQKIFILDVINIFEHKILKKRIVQTFVKGLLGSPYKLSAVCDKMIQTAS